MQKNFKRTNIEIDQNKIHFVQRHFPLNTSKETVDFALERLMRAKKVYPALLHLKGKVGFSKNYNYKEER